MAYSPGSFVLKKVGLKKGEYFEGEFTATFYFFSWCQRSDKKSLSGKFRIRATE
ncbi:hypothetical protein [Paraflavitalea pollutisoli]|uniref:hypothetical protein n=1 Tax=Paraflavitalea pollutisoli TaxID=3034143 RepID=UPI0023EB5BB4|nr:hypothetical protein [Paraflavitalea sp. H1-2-19X]